MINNFFLQEKFLILAYDHGLEHGPSDFSKENFNPDFILEIASKEKVSAIVLTPGVAEKFYPKFQTEVPLILKLNGKTKFFQGEPVSLAFASIDLAKKLNAIAVGYTLYPGSRYESLMFKEFGRIKEEAHQKGLGVIAWIYPKGKSIENETDSKIIKYAARIGLELGADLIKIKYPSENIFSLKSLFEEIRRISPKVKIALAGGKKLEEEEFLEVVKSAMESGLNGIVVGRNVWQGDNPYLMIEKIKKIIFKENEII